MSGILLLGQEVLTFIPPLPGSGNWASTSWVRRTGAWESSTTKSSRLLAAVIIVSSIKVDDEDGRLWKLSSLKLISSSGAIVATGSETSATSSATGIRAGIGEREWTFSDSWTWETLTSSLGLGNERLA